MNFDAEKYVAQTLFFSQKNYLATTKSQQRGQTQTNNSCGCAVGGNAG